MTSTSFNVGLAGDGSRLSSRVLRPPGGGHTDIFGGDPEPPRGRRQAPPQPATNFMGQGDEPKPTNGSVEPPQNGQESQPQAQAATPDPVPEAKPEPKQAEPPRAEAPRAEPPKRVRVPPGGFSSGLWFIICGDILEESGRLEETSAVRSRGLPPLVVGTKYYCFKESASSTVGCHSMEGRHSKSRLGRLLKRLRGDHPKQYSLDKGISICSTAMSESTGCASTAFDEDDILGHTITQEPQISNVPSDFIGDDDNIDLRYGGQYMTAEQLPEFCDQLHHLVQVIRNIQSYAQVTGEYPADLERRLEREAREVAALAAETRNARDVIERTRLQRRALHDHRQQLHEQLASLKETEVRQLESTVRLSDRKLFKNWESLKDTNDPAAFDPLLEEIRSKQTALECLVRLIEGRRAALAECTASPRPLPPVPRDSNDESSTTSGGLRKRYERRANKRRRYKEPRSVPASSEPSAHANLPQMTLLVQGSETSGRQSTGAALELPSGGSVRDILFFTAYTG